MSETKKVYVTAEEMEVLKKKTAGGETQDSAIEATTTDDPVAWLENSLRDAKTLSKEQQKAFNSRIEADRSNRDKQQISLARRYETKIKLLLRDDKAIKHLFKQKLISEKMYTNTSWKICRHVSDTIEEGIQVGAFSAYDFASTDGQNVRIMSQDKTNALNKRIEEYFARRHSESKT